jgi:hypothetical protein
MTLIELQPVRWRADIDSLAFAPPQHQGQCVVHRRAFRTLLGIEATPQACIDYFHAHRIVFEAAAAAKIARRELPRDMSFHLNSRDIRRFASPAQ